MDVLPNCSLLESSVPLVILSALDVSILGTLDKPTSDLLIRTSPVLPDTEVTKLGSALGSKLFSLERSADVIIWPLPASVTSLWVVTEP